MIGNIRFGVGLGCRPWGNDDGDKALVDTCRTVREALVVAVASRSKGASKAAADVADAPKWALSMMRHLLARLRAGFPSSLNESA
jgi:hypothetical protein